MAAIHIHDLRIVDLLKKDKIPFQIISTTLTIKIFSERGNYVYMPGDRIPKRELYFINKVKRHVENTLPKDFIFNRPNIDYYHFGDCKPGEVYKNCFEIDINSAYWFLAYKHGFISKQLFEEGCNKEKISKKTRLASLGVLAKKTREHNFDGKEFEVGEEKRSFTEGVFFFVAAEVGNILKRLSLSVGKSFIFFWVDAIFVKDDASYQFLLSEFTKLDLYVKAKQLKYIKIKQNSFEVRGYDDKPGELDKRDFYVPSANISAELSRKLFL